MLRNRIEMGVCVEEEGFFLEGGSGYEDIGIRDGDPFLFQKKGES